MKKAWIYRKIILGILSVAFSLVTLTTTTFAWFTLTTRTTVDNFDFSVTLGTELEISLDGKNFTTEISSSALKEAIGSQLFLKDVTTMDGREFVAGVIDPVPAVANHDYVSLTVYFRARRENQAVFLVDNNGIGLHYGEVHSDLGTFFVSQGIDWKSSARFIYDELGTVIEPGTVKKLYASDSLRISFIEEKVDEEILGSADERPEEELVRTIYDPSENEVRGFGKTYGAVGYWNAKHFYDKLTPPEEIPNTITSLTKIQGDIPTDYNSKIVALQKGAVVDDKQYYYGKATINIWLEGWDADCFNAILQDKIKIQLRFRGAKIL
jgi:hypothetical protein